MLMLASLATSACCRGIDSDLSLQTSSQLLNMSMMTCVSNATHANDTSVSRRRSGNMSPAPNSHSPFEQAAAFLRHRKAARPTKSDGTLALHHDQDLAASISRAWIALPGDLRRAGWPSWCEHAELVTA